MKSVTKKMKSHAETMDRFTRTEADSESTIGTKNVTQSVQNGTRMMPNGDQNRSKIRPRAEGPQGVLTLGEDVV